MTLLTINNRDYTPHILVPSWNVCTEEIFTEWIDGFGTYHRDVTRKRVTGSWDFLFTRPADFSTFLDDLEAVRTANNSYTVSAYIDNEEITETLDAFLTFDVNMTRIAGGSVDPDRFTVTLEER